MVSHRTMSHVTLSGHFLYKKTLPLAPFVLFPSKSFSLLTLVSFPVDRTTIIYPPIHPSIQPTITHIQLATPFLLSCNHPLSSFLNKKTNMQFASIFASTSTAEPPQASRSAFSNKRKHDLDGSASRSEETDFCDRKIIHVRKQPRLPPLNLPTSQTSFQFSSPSSSPLESSHSFHRQIPGNTMDVDCAGSSDSECELRTPSVAAYPNNLAQYPFGILDGKTSSGNSSGMMDDGMSVDEDHVKVGVLGIGQDFGRNHGAHCNQIPRLVLSHPNPMGERSLWAVCQDCGAASPAS